MRVVRWVIVATAVAVLAGFIGGFAGALLAPNRQLDEDPSSGAK